MSMTGVLVNTGTILVGSAVGLLFKKGIPERVTCLLYTSPSPRDRG